MKCYVVGYVGSEGLLVDVKFVSDGEKLIVENEVCRAEVPSAKQTDYKCAKCGKPFKVDEKVIGDFYGSGFEQPEARIISFIAHGDAVYIKGCGSWRDIWKPEWRNGLVHASDVTNEQLVAWTKARLAWHDAMDNAEAVRRDILGERS